MSEQDYTPAADTKAPAKPAPAAATATASPADELKKLKEALASEQKEADELKKRMDAQQAQIKQFEKSLADTSQVTTAFAAALQGVATERLEIKEFLTNDLPRLADSDEVKSKAAEIKLKTGEVNDAIARKASEVDALGKKVDAEKAALESANQEQSAKKQQLDDLKDRQRTIQEQFTKLRKLRQRIDTDGKDKPLVRYVLARELEQAWAETKDLLVSKEELESLYYAKSDAARAAAATAAAQDTKYKAAQAEFETTRKDLDALRNARLDDLVKAVSGITTAMPVGAAAKG